MNVSGTYLNLAVENGIKLHTVYLGTGTGSAKLEAYAAMTGGEAFIAASASELEEIYSNLSFSGQSNKDGLLDADRDGLPDEIERLGIPMPNGSIVYTDVPAKTDEGTDDADEKDDGKNKIPEEYDTDGDGLSDGQEVGSLIRRQLNYYIPEEYATYKFYFNVKSDPTLYDTDGNGYSDYAERITYHSDAMYNNVKIYSIGNGDGSREAIQEAEYIQVADKGWEDNYPSYGGNQDWFSNADGNSNGASINKSGCGLISCSDILLYLAINNPEYRTNLTTDFIGYDTNGFIEDTSYRDYVYAINRFYSVENFYCQNGVWLMAMMNGYSNTAGFN